jgi:hypothetical protein
MSLSIQLQEHIESFLADHDLSSLYREYKWGRDMWENGFPDMRQLEVDLTRHAKQGYVTESDIMKVAEWGGLRNKKRVQCPEQVRISLYGGDDLAEFFRTRPSAPLRPLRDAIKGMGPTYLSKVLMFSRPQLYGAIDTRLVRVFGRGDTDIEPLRWLLLGVKNYGYGWYIPEYQTSWPGEYDTWIGILHHIASLCNSSGHKCPHPDEYIATGLREKGIWIAADVETALFSYASGRLQAVP